MRRALCVGAALLLMALLAGVALGRGLGANDTESLPLNLDQQAAPEPGASPGSYLLRALLSLALVVCLIYAVYYGLRWWRGGLLRAREGEGIVVLDHARLDGDKSVYVVALGDKVVVLGASGSDLRMLCELGEEEAAAFQEAVEGDSSVHEAEKKGPRARA